MTMPPFAAMPSLFSMMLRHAAADATLLIPRCHTRHIAATLLLFSLIDTLIIASHFH